MDIFEFLQSCMDNHRILFAISWGGIGVCSAIICVNRLINGNVPDEIRRLFINDDSTDETPHE